MLTIQEILTKVNSMKEATPINIDDFCINSIYGKVYVITFNNFDGFDDNYQEVMNNDYDEDAVADFEEWLNDNCKEFSRAYDLYVFDDFSIRTKYTSENI